MDLKSNNKATPELEHSPARSEANDRPPDKKSCVKRTEEAQFGIKPIREDRKGWKTEPLSISEEKTSVPINSIIKPIKKVKINNGKTVINV